MKSIKNNLDKILIIVLISFATIFGFLNKNNDNSNDILLETELESKNEENNNIYDTNYETKFENVSEIKIHISGCIKNPGVYSLKLGSRIDDAVNIAGGFCEDVDISSINLSKKLSDEMKIHVYRLGEEIINTIEENSSINSKNSLVNINTASVEELMSLSGIGKSKASDIIEYRKKAKFNSIDELKNISGIGDKLFEKIKEFITIDWKKTIYLI